MMPKCDHDFTTDPSDVASCDRNNCRCGDSQNCMYYNSPGASGKSHYNYVAVQGTGDPSSPYYSCANRAADHFNEEQMYADHAGMILPGPDGSATQLPVDFGGCAHGERNMCGACAGAFPSDYPWGPVGWFTAERVLALAACAAFVWYAVRQKMLDVRDPQALLLIAAMLFGCFFF